MVNCTLHVCTRWPQQITDYLGENIRFKRAWYRHLFMGRDRSRRVLDWHELTAVRLQLLIRPDVMYENDASGDLPFRGRRVMYRFTHVVGTFISRTPDTCATIPRARTEKVIPKNDKSLYPMNN